MRKSKISISLNLLLVISKNMRERLENLRQQGAGQV